MLTSVEYPVISKEYPVIVDRNRSRVETVKAINCLGVIEDINDKTFPVKGKGERKENIVLIYLWGHQDTKSLISRIDEVGYRPVNADEILALGEQYPDLQKEFTIAALGSVWRKLNLWGLCGSSRYVISLDYSSSGKGYEHSDQRYIELVELDPYVPNPSYCYSRYGNKGRVEEHTWDDKTRFAAVLK